MPDGTAHMIFASLDLIGKLATLVPPPRFNLTRIDLFNLWGYTPFKTLKMHGPQIQILF
jgi:hypothetical protein